jgi:uncharacterized protein YbjT (DUF2867 family)
MWRTSSWEIAAMTVSPSNLPAVHTPRIAISGATGRVGAQLINSLINDPVDLLALTRTPAKTRFPSGVDVASIDFDQADTLPQALDGVDTLFLAHGTSDRQVENEIALIDAAVVAGVTHIVKLSAMGPATPLNPFAWHMRIEAHLAIQPVASTVLRPTAFADVLKRAGAQVANGTWGGSAGNGAVNFIDTRDVAQTARVALLEEVSTRSQRAYHLTGPRAWTMQDIAAELTRLLQRPVAYHQRSATEHRAMLIREGASALMADLLSGMDLMYHESALSEITLTVEQMTGESPRDLSDWLIENISLFR